MMEWIRVEDKVPDLDQVVLLYGVLETQSTADIYIGRRVDSKIFKDSISCGKEIQYWESHWGYDVEVTHWLPISELPKEE